MPRSARRSTAACRPIPPARPTAAELRAVLSGRAQAGGRRRQRRRTAPRPPAGPQAPAAARRRSWPSDRARRARRTLAADRRADRARQGAGAAVRARRRVLGQPASACSSAAPTGQWLVSPVGDATNETLVNGETLTAPAPAAPGRRDRGRPPGEGHRQDAAHRARGRMSGDLGRNRRRGTAASGPPAAAVRRLPRGCVGGGRCALRRGPRTGDSSPASRGGAGEEEPGIQSEPLWTKPAEPRDLASSSIPTPPPVEVSRPRLGRPSATPSTRRRSAPGCVRRRSDGSAARPCRRAGHAVRRRPGDPADRAIRVSATNAAAAVDRRRPAWRPAGARSGAGPDRPQKRARVHARPRIVFLGDFFDDEGFGLEVLLRVFELVLEAPGASASIAGNHDEALSYDGVRFARPCRRPTSPSS